MTQQQMAAIFNEWARRYAENPNGFSSILDEDGKPVEDYGQRCAIYFTQITQDLEAQGVLSLEKAGLKMDHLDVQEFHLKFGVPVALTPSLLGPKTFDFRLKFLHEELREFHESHMFGDLEGAADALIDLAYVIHGTAHMMGLPWPQLWNEVQRANMSKVRATDASQSKRGSSLDVIKPEGWQPPNHLPLLGEGPWPTHGD